ncbi:MAG: DUF3619 family protein [Burkholderiaceae bacterium]
MNEAQFGARLARVLDTSTDRLPSRITSRLASARETALARAPRSAFVTVAAAHPSLAGPAAPHALPRARFGALAGASAPRGDSPRPWWRWLGVVMPLLIVLAGWVSISYWDDVVKAEELADVDTDVLTDDLPLETLAERGFGVFLTTTDAKP